MEAWLLERKGAAVGRNDEYECASLKPFRVRLQPCVLPLGELQPLTVGRVVAAGTTSGGGCQRTKLD